MDQDNVACIPVQEYQLDSYRYRGLGTRLWMDLSWVYSIILGAQLTPSCALCPKYTYQQAMYHSDNTASFDGDVYLEK
jgi:hypothetical protein